MKVIIKKAGDGEFQVDIEPSQTVVDLKKEINKAKDYPTEHQRLIHSGRNLRDDVVFETMDFNPEKDTIVLLVSKPRPAQPTTQPSSPSPLSSTPLPETVRPQGEPASTAAGPSLFQQKSPAQFPSRPTAPIRPKGEYVPAVAGPSSLKQWNPNQTTNGISHEGSGAFKDKGKQVSREEPIHNDPRLRQMLLSSIAEDNPAMAKHFEENPALFDSLMQKASAAAEKELANPQSTMRMSAEEIGAIERLVALGFTRHRAIEAYLVSDKNEELAVNYLLNADVSGPANMANGNSFSSKDPMDLIHDSSFRQVLTDSIAKEDPAMAEDIRQNPHLFEEALQSFVLEKGAEKAEDVEDIQYLVDLGFTREQAMEAYLVSEKDRGRAVEYLVTVHADTQGETNNTSNSQGYKSQGISKPPAHNPTQTTTKTNGHALVEDDTITVISPSVQSALTTKDTRAIQRLVNLGFTKEQATEAYLLCDNDEDQTQDYLQILRNNMESVPDNSVIDHSPAVTGMSSPTQIGSELPESIYSDSDSPPSKQESRTQHTALSQRSQAFVLLLGFFLVFLHPFIGLFIVAGLAWQRVNA